LRRGRFPLVGTRDALALVLGERDWGGGADPTRGGDSGDSGGSAKHDPPVERSLREAGRSPLVVIRPVLVV